MTTVSSVHRLIKTLAIILAGYAMSPYALAESEMDTSMPPPPLKQTVDARGIDLLSGSNSNALGMSVSIGAPESGIRRAPGGYLWGKDNFSGSLTLMKINRETHPGEPGAGLPTGRYVTVSTGLSSVLFREENTSGEYKPIMGTRGELSCSSSSCQYTASDGTVFLYDKSISNGWGDYLPVPLTTSGPSMTRTNIGMLTQTVRPNGEVIKITYANDDRGLGGRLRKTSVSSSLGWMLKYHRESAGRIQPYNGDKKDSFTYVYDSIKAINRAVEYCDGGAGACDHLSHPWPSSKQEYSSLRDYVSMSVDETKLNQTRTSIVTDPSGGTYKQVSYKEGGDTSYVDTATYPSGISHEYTISICASYYYPAGSCVPSPSSGKVTSLKIGEYSFGYKYGPFQYFSTFASEVSGPDGSIGVDFRGPQLTSYTDNLGRVNSYEYTQGLSGFIKKIVDPDATPSVDDPVGGYTEYEYDDRGNITHIKRYPKNGGAPLTTVAEYPPTCNNKKTCNKPTAITKENGVRRDFTYHSQSGNVETIRWPTVGDDRAEVRFRYEQLTPKVRNSDGNLVNSTPVWKLTEVSKCIVGYLNSCVGTSDELLTIYEYDHHNLLMTSVTQATGDGSISLTTTKDYDIYGNLKWEDGPKPGAHDRTYYFYNALQQKTGEIGPDPDGSGPLRRQGTRIYYNADGDVKEIRHGLVSSTSFAALDSMYADEKVVKEYEPTSGLHAIDKIYAKGALKRVIQRSYDSRMRLECKAVRLAPTAFGSLPSSACALGDEGPDGNDRITKYVYDDTNALVEVIKGYGTSNEKVEKKNNYRADNGLLQSVEDGLGNTTFYDYDAFNRLEKTTYPDPNDGSSRSSTDYVKNTYTGAELSSVRLRDGKVVSLLYDDKGRNRAKSGALSESIRYNNFDQITYHSSNTTGGELSRVYTNYSPLGWKNNEEVRYGNSSVSLVDYEYDDYGRKTKLIWPDGFYVTYDYDVGGYPSANVQRIEDPASTSLAAYEYDSYGRIKALTRGNGVTTDYEYDDESRLELMSTNLSGSNDDVYEAFSYTIAGQLKSKDMDVRNPNYIYSPTSNSTVDYSVNALNQMTATNSSPVTYDGRGNLETRAGITYTYQADNLMTKVVKSGTTTRLVYDAHKRLFSISKSGNSTRFVHDGSEMIAETDTNGSVKSRYVHGIGVDDPIVWYEGAGTSNKRYYTKNHQGSVVGGSYQSGRKAFINAYDEYGVNASYNQGRFRYTGQIWLREIGLYYYKARMYDADIGRFMQTDPIGYADQMNLYAYVHNDPINFKDPSGKYAEAGLEAASISWGITSFVNNVSEGNWGAAAVDAVGVALDGVGAAIPFVPGVASAGIQLSRGAESTVEAAKLEKQLASESQLSQLSEGGGAVIGQPADQANRIAAQTGSDPSNIQKVSSDAHTAKDGQQVQTHAYRDETTNEIIEPKTIIKEDN